MKTVIVDGLRLALVCIFCLLHSVAAQATIEIRATHPPSTGKCDGWIETFTFGATGPYSIEVYHTDNVSGVRSLVNSYTNINGSLLISNLCPGGYDIVVSGNTFCTTSLYENLEECPVITISDPILVEPSGCHSTDGGFRFLSAISGGTAPYSFFWNTGATQLNIENIVAGVYRLTITDALNCTADFEYTLTGFTEPQITGGSDEPACPGQDNGNYLIMLNGPDAITYDFAWSNGSSNNNSIFSEIKNVSAGTYQVTITEHGSDCSLVRSFTVPEVLPDGPLTISGNINDDCATSPGSGSIELAAEGGTKPYQYRWDAGATSSFQRNQYNLAAGNYCVTVNDYCQNQVSQCYEVTFGENDPIELVSNLYPGNNFGDIELLASGGDGVYTYEWSNGETGDYLADVPSGSYNVTVTDGTGCAKVETVSLNNCGYTWPFETSGALYLEVSGSEEQYEANGSEGIPPTLLRCDGSQHNIRVTEISGSIGPYTLIIEAANGPNAGTRYFTQQVDGSAFHYDITVPRTGRYLVKVYDICGNEVIHHVDACEYCGYEYDIEDNKYTLFEGALVFEMNCYCPSECTYPLGFNKHVKITATVQPFAFEQDYYLVTWPDGSSSTFYPTSNDETFDFEDHGDANQVFTISVSRGNDGCEVTVPISLLENGTGSVVFVENWWPIRNNGQEEDFFIGNLKCDLCGPEIGYYEEEEVECLGNIELRRFYYIPYNYDTPCSGGGRLRTYQIIDGVVEFNDVVIPPYANIPADIYNAQIHNLFPGLDCTFTGGSCVFDALDVFGFSLSKRLLLPYCKEFGPDREGDPFVDSDADGIPDDIDECPHDPDPFCSALDTDGDGVPNEDEGTYNEGCHEEEVVLDYGCDIRVYRKCDDGTSTLLYELDGENVQPCRQVTIDGDCIRVRAYCTTGCHYEVLVNPGNTPTSYPEDAYYNCDNVNIQVCDDLITDSGCGSGITANEELTLSTMRSQEREEEKSLLLQVYPNPFTDQLYVNYSLSTEEGLIDISIYNSFGQKALQKSYELGKGAHALFLDTSNLRQGVYHLVVTNENGKYVSTKIIKVGF